MESGKRLWLEASWLAVCLLVTCSGLPRLHRTQRGTPDVYEQLWTSSLDVAQQTLELPFLQHLRIGDMQADDYVTFMIQDINYLLKLTDMLKEMSDKVKKPEDVREFMKARYESYKRFSESMLKQFNLNGVSDIKPIPAMQKYLANYKAIMEQEEPIFFAVGLLPCERLWLWLANQLNKMSYGNAYFIWKRNNMHGNPGKKYRKLLNDNLKTPEQIERAEKIFRQQMQNEHDFFAASLNE